MHNKVLSTLAAFTLIILSVHSHSPRQGDEDVELSASGETIGSVISSSSGIASATDTVHAISSVSQITHGQAASLNLGADPESEAGFITIASSILANAHGEEGVSYASGSSVESTTTTGTASTLETSSKRHDLRTVSATTRTTNGTVAVGGTSAESNNALNTGVPFGTGDSTSIVSISTVHNAAAAESSPTETNAGIVEASTVGSASTNTGSSFVIGNINGSTTTSSVGSVTTVLSQTARQIWV